MYRPASRTVLATALLLAGCLAIAEARATGNWFALDTEPGMGSLEVDVSSLRWRGDRRELKVRISYPQAQQPASGPGYRALLATLEMNCETGQSQWRSVSFHADAHAEDPALAVEQNASGLPASPAQALVPEKTWATLLRSACTPPRAMPP